MPVDTFDPAAPSIAPLVRRLGNLLGWLCVMATLALSAPGVVATAKGEPMAAAQGPSCGSTERSGETTAVNLTRMIEQLRAEIERNADPSDEVVALDNRGLSYPVAPSPPHRSADPKR